MQLSVGGQRIQVDIHGAVPVVETGADLDEERFLRALLFDDGLHQHHLVPFGHSILLF